MSSGSSAAANQNALAPPIVNHAIPDQSLFPDRVFSFQFAADAFSDPDNDPLSYTATLSDGSALPSWLAFDGAVRTFSGTAPHDAFSSVAVKVTANDGTSTASDTFSFLFVLFDPAPINGTAGADA